MKKKEKRADYIESLMQSQDAENPTAFIDFMMSHHTCDLEQQILEYKKLIDA